MKRTLINASLVIFLATPALAQEYIITLKNHQFTPNELEIPADQKVKVTVQNENTAAAEFESHDLHREKIIAPGGKAVVSIGPLKPGKYEYFDEFNQDKSRGFIVVK